MKYEIVDGNHRAAALKELWEKDQLQVSKQEMLYLGCYVLSHTTSRETIDWICFEMAKSTKSRAVQLTDWELFSIVATRDKYSDAKLRTFSVFIKNFL